MSDSVLYEDYSILLLESSDTHRDLFKSWLTNIITKTASTSDDIINSFDSSVAVACLSQSALGEDEEEIRNYILNRNPYCQLVLILSRSSSVALNKQHYDACLERPVFEEDLRATLQKRMKFGVYSALLHEFYYLNTERISREQGDTPGEDEAELCVETLETRIRHLKTRLNILQQSIGVEDSKELFRSLALHKQYLTEPAQNIDESIKSKFHPNKCRKCKLPWGVDHRNELGGGFETIGAYVWKCNRCREITHGSSPGDRHVARR